MMSPRAKRLLMLALRIVLGAVFIVAGALKIGDPMAFADSIWAFQLVPNVLVMPMALMLPVFEIAAGMLLIVGLMRGTAALATILLTAVFTAAIASAIARGLTLDCGCFGQGAPTVRAMWLDLGRDLLLLAGACIVYFYRAPAEPAAGQGVGTTAC